MLYRTARRVHRPVPPGAASALVIFAAFRTRSFRFQWPADLVTSWAFEMETLILGWWVMVTTGSVLWLSAFGSLLYVGTLAAPMYGVLGDRLGGRTVLCAMRAVYAVLAALLATLALADWLTPTAIVLIAAVGGLVRPNDMVLRNALIAETVPQGHLMNALGLSRATMDSARAAGALTGAGLSTFLGIGPSYVVVTACYAASLALTFGVARRRPVPDPAASPPAAEVATSLPSRAMNIATPGSRLATTAPVARPRSSQWRDLVNGLAHVLRTPELLAMMLLAFLVNLTAYPISGGLLPYVARTVFRVDATGLGWLAASFALGGLAGSIVTVLMGGPRRADRATLVFTALWYALLFGFGQVATLGAGLLALFPAGFVQNLAMIAMTASLLAAAGEGFRGRVMGVRMLAVYGFPLGLLALGYGIGHAGWAATVGAATLLGVAVTLLIAVRWRAALWHGAPFRG